ncbi:hypothetical protein [Chengkuizengella marina]|uniref:Uncharacterized protein n=1 Tax=Chengkuizengella marina TaxID=2507566 RepID=A0A6N9Q0Y1_9BACL|nr:hypothetical protein [Chengkuizengella marina]NBI27790.1 hypothetical protein [Chengkuizengella marina]
MNLISNKFLAKKKIILIAVTVLLLLSMLISNVSNGETISQERTTYCLKIYNKVDTESGMHYASTSGDASNSDYCSDVYVEIHKDGFVAGSNGCGSVGGLMSKRSDDDGFVYTTWYDDALELVNSCHGGYSDIYTKGGAPWHYYNGMWFIYE